MQFGLAGGVASPERAGTAELGAVVVRPSNSQSWEDEEQDHVECELPARTRPCRHEHGAAVCTSMLELRLEVLKTSRILFVIWVMLVSALPKTELWDCELPSPSTPALPVCSSVTLSCATGVQA